MTSSEEIWEATMDNELEVMQQLLYSSDVNYNLQKKKFKKSENKQNAQCWMFR